ncbi:hypothetical protein ScPMuIL_001747 [Solemya velum]
MEEPKASKLRSEEDFLKDIIPYRCPKCGNSKKFATLRELKSHLEKEHSFKMGFVKPRTRVKVFSHRAKSLSSSDDEHHMPTRLPLVQEAREDDKRLSTLMDSYREDARVLEEQLRSAKDAEALNKLGPSSRVTEDGLRALNVRDRLSTLNTQVMNSRQSQWETEDKLHKAHDVLGGIEKAAEGRCTDQRVVIQELVKDLKDKEGELVKANGVLDKLKNEREKLVQETEVIFQDAEFGNESLREELRRRESELSLVSGKLEEVKSLANTEISSRENALGQASHKIEALEKDRDKLIYETDRLLKQADSNAALLKKTLREKEEQLEKVNVKFEKLKNEQQSLLKESVDLYKKADEGTKQMKGVLSFRDSQLHDACKELERMRALQKGLVWESQELTNQADKGSKVMQQLLRQKDMQLKNTQNALERLKLQQKYSSAKGGKPAFTDVDLQNAMVQKEKKLEETQKELTSLKKFLQSAAQKEIAARDKLEAFISDLIDRADRAEREVAFLKTQTLSPDELSSVSAFSEDKHGSHKLKKPEPEPMPRSKYLKPVSRKSCSPVRPAYSQTSSDDISTSQVQSLSSQDFNEPKLKKELQTIPNAYEHIRKKDVYVPSNEKDSQSPAFRRDSHDLTSRKNSCDPIPEKDSHDSVRRGSYDPIPTRDCGPSQNGLGVSSQSTPKQFPQQMQMPVQDPVKFTDEISVAGQRNVLPSQLQRMPDTYVSGPAGSTTAAMNYTLQPQSEIDQSNYIRQEPNIPTGAYTNQILSPVQLMSQSNNVQGQVPPANQVNMIRSMNNQVVHPPVQVVQPSHDGIGQIPIPLMMSPYTGQILSPIHVVPPSYEDVQLRQQSVDPSQNIMAAPYGGQILSPSGNLQQQMPMSSQQVVNTISYPHVQTAPIRNFIQAQPMRRQYRQPYQIIDETSDADAYYDDSETQYVPMRRGYMRSSPKKKQKGYSKRNRYPTAHKVQRNEFDLPGKSLPAYESSEDGYLDSGEAIYMDENGIMWDDPDKLSYSSHINALLATPSGSDLDSSNYLKLNPSSKNGIERSRSNSLRKNPLFKIAEKYSSPMDSSFPGYTQMNNTTKFSCNDRVLAGSSADEMKGISWGNKSSETELNPAPVSDKQSIRSEVIRASQKGRGDNSAETEKNIVIEKQMGNISAKNGAGSLEDVIGKHPTKAESRSTPDEKSPVNSVTSNESNNISLNQSAGNPTVEKKGHTSNVFKTSMKNRKVYPDILPENDSSNGVNLESFYVQPDFTASADSENKKSPSKQIRTNPTAHSEENFSPKVSVSSEILKKQDSSPNQHRRQPSIPVQFEKVEIHPLRKSEASFKAANSPPKSEFAQSTNVHENLDNVPQHKICKSANRPPKPPPPNWAKLANTIKSSHLLNLAVKEKARSMAVNKKKGDLSSDSSMTDNSKKEDVSPNSSMADSKKKDSVSSKSSMADNKKKDSVSSNSSVADNKKKDSVSSNSSVADNKKKDSVSSNSSMAESKKKDSESSNRGMADNKKKDNVSSNSSVADNKKKDSISSKSNMAEDKKKDRASTDSSMPDNKKKDNVSTNSSMADNKKKDSVFSKFKDKTSKRANSNKPDKSPSTGKTVSKQSEAFTEPSTPLSNPDRLTYTEYGGIIGPTNKKLDDSYTDVGELLRNANKRGSTKDATETSKRNSGVQYPAKDTKGHSNKRADQEREAKISFSDEINTNNSKSIKRDECNKGSRRPKSIDLRDDPVYADVDVILGPTKRKENSVKDRCQIFEKVPEERKKHRTDNKKNKKDVEFELTERPRHDSDIYSDSSSAYDNRRGSSGSTSNSKLFQNHEKYSDSSIDMEETVAAVETFALCSRPNPNSKSNQQKQNTEKKKSSNGKTASQTKTESVDDLYKSNTLDVSSSLKKPVKQERNISMTQPPPKPPRDSKNLQKALAKEASEFIVKSGKSFVTVDRDIANTAVYISSSDDDLDYDTSSLEYPDGITPQMKKKSADIEQRNRRPLQQADKMVESRHIGDGLNAEKNVQSMYIRNEANVGESVDRRHIRNEGNAERSVDSKLARKEKNVIPEKTKMAKVPDTIANDDLSITGNDFQAKFEKVHKQTFSEGVSEKQRAMQKHTTQGMRDEIMRDGSILLNSDTSSSNGGPNGGFRYHEHIESENDSRYIPKESDCEKQRPDVGNDLGNNWHINSNVVDNKEKQAEMPQQQQALIHTGIKQSEIRESPHTYEVETSSGRSEHAPSSGANSFRDLDMSRQQSQPYDTDLDSVFESEKSSSTYNNGRNTGRKLSISGSSMVESYLENVPKTERFETKRRRKALLCVFKYLNHKTLARVALVCREWKAISRSPSLWINVELKFGQISSKYLETISDWCSQMKSLTLEGLRPRGRNSKETQDEYLEKTRASLEPGLEQLLKKSESTLLTLKVFDCGNILTERCLWAASGYSRMLRNLTYMSDTDPVAPEVLWALGAGCGDIRSLVIPPLFPCQKPHRFNNQCLQIIAQCCPDLQLLGIGGKQIDIKGFTLIAKCCQKLQKLELHHMGTVLEETIKSMCNVGLHSLTDLDLIHTCIEIKGLEHLFNCCKMKSVNVNFKFSDCYDESNRDNLKKYDKNLKDIQEFQKKKKHGDFLKLTAEEVEVPEFKFGFFGF